MLSTVEVAKGKLEKKKREAQSDDKDISILTR